MANMFGGLVRIVAGVVVLDNYYRLKMVKALQKRSYYISELQREIGIKTYKSMWESVQKLAQYEIVKLEKKHDTSGRHVLITLNKEYFDTVLTPSALKDLMKKHGLA